MQKFIGLMLVFVIGTGTAFARDHEMIKDMAIDTTVNTGVSHSEMEMEHDSATSTMDGRDHAKIKNFRNEQHGGIHATSTENVDLHKVMKAVQILKHGLPGLVTSVSSNSFMMTVPAGKDHATTSVTVNVSSSTKFTRASTTASLSDITAGTRVEVLGVVSTSSKSIAAERVIIGSNMKNDSNGNGLKKGFFERFKHFFMIKHASTTDAMIDARGSATAEVGGGFVMKALRSIFGWM